MQVFVLFQCKLEGLSDGTAGLRAERCLVQSGWALWKQGLELLLFALCVQKQKHLSSLLFIPTVVGFGPLSTSWGRRNGWLGSSHWLNICPLKGMVQGWAGISQD